MVIIGDRAVNIVGERVESFETPLVCVFIVIGQYTVERFGRIRGIGTVQVYGIGGFSGLFLAAEFGFSLGEGLFTALEVSVGDCVDIVCRV